MATSSSMSITNHQLTYDVFMSFRGEDIRKSFMDHLFSDFKRKGIHAFRDDGLLRRGEEISSEIYRAIEQSRFLVVIFTNNYASSTWCLRELVKILECKKMGKEKYEVRTIFYDVNPAMVRNQSGSYAEAFTKHHAWKEKEVPKWKEALTKAADISGWDLRNMVNGYESKLVDMISAELLCKLNVGPLHVGENLVGIQSRANRMNLSRFLGSSEVNMIGICGIGGIGKTSIAKAIYNQLYVNFEGCSFCEDVKGVAKQHGLVRLQMQLIDDIMYTRNLKIRSVGEGISVMKQRMPSKQVLVVLDNVDDHIHLEALVGSPNWFGSGSIIVVTARDRQLLNAHGVEEIYEVDYLKGDESLELFSLYAFKEECPKEGYTKLSEQIVRYVKGHPLALKVLGSFLYGKTVHEWENELDRLHTHPIDIPQVLRSSYEGLDFNQKSIFLDVACSLKGEKKDFAAKILDSCNFFAYRNIRVLVDKSLLTISSDMRLKMHDLVQRMGWDIVREESRNPGERSRLWTPKDVCDVLNKDKVTEAVEVVVLVLDSHSQKVQIHCKSFGRMNNLRILKICDSNQKDFGEQLATHPKVDYHGSLDFLSNELRWLCWHGYPFKFLPSTFFPESLVALDMSYSKIGNLWTGSKGFSKLKSIKLRYCPNLTTTPNFKETPNLEELLLEGCINLVEVHPSVGILKNLLFLNLKNCKNLKSFANGIGLESLQHLILSGCSKMEHFPDGLENMKALVELHVDGTSIRQLPSSVSSLSNLQVLSLAWHEGVQSRSWISLFWPSSLQKNMQHPTALVLPSFSGLRSLTYLNVSHCNLSEASLDGIGCLSSLKRLNLSGNDFTSIPASLSQLSQLEYLGVVGCKRLQALPKLPPTVYHIDAFNCMSLRKLHKPPTLYRSSRLHLFFDKSSKLVEKQSLESLARTLMPQERIHRFKRVSLMFPGSRIPVWFSNQSTTDCIKIELPPDWSYCKLKGIAYCVVCTPTNRNGCKTKYLGIRYDVRNFDGVVINYWRGYGYLSPSESTRIESDLVMVGSDTDLSPHAWKKVKNFFMVRFKVKNGKLKSCGVRLVQEEDEREEEEVEGGARVIQWHPPAPADNYGGFHPSHDVKSAAIEDEPPLKKIRSP